MTKTIDSDPGFKKTINNLKGPNEVFAGLLGDVNEFLLIIGGANEFGVENADGTIRIPSRPFIRSTYDLHKDQIAKMLEKQIIPVVMGKTTVKKVLDKVGVFFVGKVKERMGDSPSPFQKNADSTLKKKFPKDQPLIESVGRLRSAVAHTFTKQE